MKTLSIATLKEKLDYDAISGEFIWKDPGFRNKKLIGLKAGSINSKGYMQIRIGGTFYRSHRLAWYYTYGKWPTGCIDHINRVKTDNRGGNLRDVSHRINCKNTNVRSTSSTGISGVNRISNSSKYRTHISADDGREYLGIFEDFFEACCSRKSAENLHDYL